jgi:AcrR family transcriptional regulator
MFYQEARVTETLSKREFQRQERRRQILDAALLVFAQKGFHAANVSDVASQAGVSQGTIYWYFESKEALLENVVSEGFQNLIRPFMDMLRDETVSPLERLRATLSETLTWSMEHAEQLRLVLQFWTQPELLDPGSEFASALDQVYGSQIVGALAPVVAEAMRQGEIAPGDAEALAVVTAAMVDGLMLYMAALPGAAELQPRLEAAALRILQPIE